MLIITDVEVIDVIIEFSLFRNEVTVIMGKTYL